MKREFSSRRRFLQDAGRWGLFGFAALTSVSVVGGCGGEKESGTKSSGSGDGSSSGTNSGAGSESPSSAKSTIDAARDAANPCTDLSDLTPEERATRRTFEYEARSSNPAEVCQSCEFWEAPAAGEVCGGCTLFKGPIHPLGTCNSWAEKA